MPDCAELGRSPPRVRYVRLSADRLDDTLDMMERCFFTREPTFSVLAGLPGGAPADHRAWLRASLPEWHWDASWLAVDTDSDHIVGASMCGVYGAGQKDPYWRLYETKSDASRAYYRFMEQIDVTFNTFRDMKVDMVSENLLLAVDPRYGGLGIGTELCRRTSVEGAARTGAPLSICFCTSAATQRIYQRLGFRVGHAEPYAGSSLAADVDVTPIAQHWGCKIMYKWMGAAENGST